MLFPQTRFSALATSVLPSIPNPDRAGINFGLQSNKSPAISSVAIDQFLWAYTIDHNLNDRQNIHFSQWRDRVAEPTFLTWRPDRALQQPVAKWNQ